MSRGVVEIPIEVWEHSQRDAERIAFLHKEVARLTAENERLRKAGDEMAELVESEVKSTWNRNLKLKHWKESKEGKDAK